MHNHGLTKRQEICTVSKSKDKRSKMFCGIVRCDDRNMMIKCPDRMKSDDYEHILHQALGDVIKDKVEVILQHDNYPVHKAKVLTYWFWDNQGFAIDWPLCSPDLNHIENVWAIMKRRLDSQLFTFNNREEVVQMTWNSNTLETVSKIYEFMPERVQQVQKSKIKRFHNQFPMMLSIFYFMLVSFTLCFQF